MDITNIIDKIKQPLTTVLRYCWACACYFRLRGKYPGCFYSIFLRNFVDLFWSVIAAVATDAKHWNVSGNLTSDSKI